MHQKLKKIESTESTEIFLCHKCGGNGYMKTNPNCYHTCLSCLGKGSIILKK